jgi:hypothetical protein
MANNRQALDQFLDGLSEDELGRLLRKFRGFVIGRAVTHREFIELNVPLMPERPRTKEEVSALEAHGEAVAILAGAQQAFDSALHELRIAEGKRGPELADGSMLRTSEQEALVQRLAAVVEDRKDELEIARQAEVAARPHNAKKRRRKFAYPLAGFLASKSPDYSSEYTNAEVRRA